VLGQKSAAKERYISALKFLEPEVTQVHPAGPVLGVFLDPFTALSKLKNNKKAEIV